MDVLSGIYRELLLAMMVSLGLSGAEVEMQYELRASSLITRARLRSCDTNTSSIVEGAICGS